MTPPRTPFRIYEQDSPGMHRRILEGDEVKHMRFADEGRWRSERTS